MLTKVNLLKKVLKKESLLKKGTKKKFLKIVGGSLHLIFSYFFLHYISYSTIYSTSCEGGRVDRRTLSGETLNYSAIRSNSRSPSSLAWVQCTQGGLWPHPHIGWPSGLRPSAKLNPTVSSLACQWRLRSALRADRESFSIESGMHP